MNKRNVASVLTDGERAGQGQEIQQMKATNDI